MSAKPFQMNAGGIAPKTRTIVANGLGETTQCHDNGGYGSSNALISRGVFPKGNGSEHALKGKLEGTPMNEFSILLIRSEGAPAPNIESAVRAGFDAPVEWTRVEALF